MTRQSILSSVTMITMTTLAAEAADLHVPADYPTIQSAVEAAEDGDHVILADGSYSGAGNVDIDLGGRSITIRSENGADGCIVDAIFDPGANAFVYDSDPPAFGRVEGVTFRHFFTGAGDEGVIRVVNGGPRIESCVFENCATGAPGSETSPGSAIWVGGASPVVQSCRFSDNIGSAVYIGAGSVVYLVESTFERNQTWHDDGGAAVSSDGFPLSFTSVYQDNVAYALNGKGLGGAIAQRGIFLDLTGLTFDGNRATGPAGGFGMAVHVTSGFVVNGGIFRNHDDAGSGATFFVDATDAKASLSGHVSGVFEDNTMGGLQIEDPNGMSDVRLIGVEFCRNGPFHVIGNYIDFGGNAVCCPADIDGSGGVDLGDLISVLSAWGTCEGCPPDLNGDGVVGLPDLLTVLASWGPCPEL